MAGFNICSRCSKASLILHEYKHSYMRCCSLQLSSGHKRMFIT